jgi:hypothetical protein
MTLNFVVWTRVDHPASGQFVAVASALPEGHSQEVGPEERSQQCESQMLAELACDVLASELVATIHARGNQVTQRSGTPSAPALVGK